MKGLSAVILVASLLLMGCSDTSKPPVAEGPSTPVNDSSSPTTKAPSSSPPKIAQGKPYTGWPDAIVVLGHSGSTGESSDPDRSGVEVRENSWVTGTNPDVNSLYLRIVAENPNIKGHALALSEGGATVDEVLSQASAAVAEQPRNALVVIQVMDNDIVCPATQHDYAQFQTTFQNVLSELDRGLPTSRIFVVTQFGSPDTYAEALTPIQRRSFGGTGPCAFLDPEGRIFPKELHRLEKIIRGYEAALEQGCAAFARCVFDDGAFSNAVDKPQYIAPDLNHFSVAGHAEAAALAWEAMRRGGLVPAGGS